VNEPEKKEESFSRPTECVGESFFSFDFFFFTFSTFRDEVGVRLEDRSLVSRGSIATPSSRKRSSTDSTPAAPAPARRRPGTSPRSSPGCRRTAPPTPGSRPGGKRGRTPAASAGCRRRRARGRSGTSRRRRQQKRGGVLSSSPLSLPSGWVCSRGEAGRQWPLTLPLLSREELLLELPLPLLLLLLLLLLPLLPLQSRPSAVPPWRAAASPRARSRWSCCSRSPAARRRGPRLLRCRGGGPLLPLQPRPPERLERRRGRRRRRRKRP